MKGGTDTTSHQVLVYADTVNGDDYGFPDNTTEYEQLVHEGDE